jgi:EAL domain-containing protein (putative c-di-GMP-specific phosphodiesterase class I)
VSWRRSTSEIVNWARDEREGGPHYEINADPAGTSIVCAVISMGKSLGHRVVADSVETASQLASLQAQQCGEGQGYYFSRPLVVEQVAKLPTTRQSGVLQ